jgi:hypothetical protein
MLISIRECGRRTIKGNGVNISNPTMPMETLVFEQAVINEDDPEVAATGLAHV